VRPEEILDPAAIGDAEPMLAVLQGEQLLRRAGQVGRGQAEVERVLREKAAQRSTGHVGRPADGQSMAIGQRVGRSSADDRWVAKAVPELIALFPAKIKQLMV
jgi:hypothetical protein